MKNDHHFHPISFHDFFCVCGKSMLLDQHQTANPICEVDCAVDRMELFVGLRLRCPVNPIEGADAKNRGKLIPKDEQSVILGLENSCYAYKIRLKPIFSAAERSERSERSNVTEKNCHKTLGDRTNSPVNAPKKAVKQAKG